MALVLSKLIPVFLFPLGLVLILLLVCLLCLWWPGGRRWITSVLIFICLLLLWMAASPFFADRLLFSLEGRYASKQAAAYPKADVIVVLGGDVARKQTGGRLVLPGPAFDRLYLGYRLYKARKAPLMILAGGGIKWLQTPGALSESQMMAELLRQLGLPQQTLIKEDKSRNTRENAWYTRKILRKKGLGEKVLLVTSAFHMPRARACFENLGIKVIPCPADFLVDRYKKISLLDFLPDAGALEDATRALHEYMGLVYYGLRGWI